jgi:hypothetical protein
VVVVQAKGQLEGIIAKSLSHGAEAFKCQMRDMSQTKCDYILIGKPRLEVEAKRTHNLKLDLLEALLEEGFSFNRERGPQNRGGVAASFNGKKLVHCFGQSNRHVQIFCSNEDAGSRNQGRRSFGVKRVGFKEFVNKDHGRHCDDVFTS